MLLINEAVLEGKANGTQMTLDKVVLKYRQSVLIMDMNGICIHGVLASQVSYIQLRHCSDRVSPPTFKLRPDKKTFSVTSQR